jgi:ABC-type nitrate/sulfonate/bicarbonate transport system permease component
VSAIAIDRFSRAGVDGVTRRLGKAALFLVVLAALWGLWEGFRWLGIHGHWRHPFPVDDTSMPHIHTMLKALFVHTHPGGPLLIGVLWRASLFTAKEAALGFAIGAVGGFLLGTVLAH